MAIGLGSIVGGTVIGNLVTKLTLEDKQYNEGLDKSVGATDKLAAAGKIAAVGVAAVGAAMVATAVAAVKLTQSVANTGDKWDKLSQRIGMSVEKLSSYEHAATLSGTSVEAMATSVGRLSRNMRDYSKGQGEAAKAFKDLDIDVEASKGVLKSVDAVMLELADKFEKMPEGPEKVALSMELMGRSGGAMIPMLNQGSKGMAQMLKEGAKFRKWTTAEAKESALLNDNIARVNLAISGIKDKIGKALIPAFQAVIETTRDWIFENHDLIDGVLVKIPDIIKNFIVPALTLFMDVGNIVITAMIMDWKNFVIKITASVAVITTGFDLIIQGITSITKYIPGLGNVSEAASKKMSDMNDTVINKLNEQVSSIKNTGEAYKKRSEMIDSLRNSFVLKHDESRKRMDKVEYEHKEYVIDVATETNEELQKKEDDRVKAAEERAEAVKKTETALQDDINKMTLDKYEYSVLKLNEEYKEKEKTVNDTKLLDEWYVLERKKLDESETARLTRKADDDRKREEEKYEDLTKFNEEWVGKVVAGENLMQSVTDTAQTAIGESIRGSADERTKILSGAITKMITGHVAEGLAAVGATSGMTVLEKILAVGAYAGDIALQLAAAKRIGESVSFASGGWLANNPRGGVVNQGSTSHADDVFLGSRDNSNYFVSRGERIFVLNSKANEMYGDSLSFLNSSALGYASGGEVGKVDQKKKRAQIDRIAGSLGLGLLNSVISGWLGAGDLLQGIPSGLAAGGIDLGAKVGEMFVGKMAVQPVLAGAFGMKDGGFVPGGTNVGYGLGGFVKKIGKGISKVTKSVTKVLGSSITDYASGLGMFSGFGELGNILGGSSGELLNKPTNIMNNITEEMSQLIYQVLSQTKIMEWLKNIMGQVPGMHGIASALVNTDISKASTGQAASWLGDKLSIKNLLSAFDVFHDGGVITPSGMAPLKSGEVPFAGIGQVGEVLAPAGGIGGDINIYFTLNGIDRENAQSAVRDYIIPEINYYLSSKGKQEI